MKRTLKVLHELATVGVMGGAGAILVLEAVARGSSPEAYAAVRAGLAVVAHRVIFPSMVLVVISGMLAMIAHRPYMNAGWVWVKLLFGVPVFQATLAHVDAPAARLAELSAKRAAGDLSVDSAMDEERRHEQGGNWVLLVLSAGNIVLAVARPKLRGYRVD